MDYSLFNLCNTNNKIVEKILGNPIIDECNDILNNCKTKEERMEATTSIRSKVKLNWLSETLLNSGAKGFLV